VYELIAELRPYFFSLREIKNNVSLDIRLPIAWKIEHVEKVISQYKSMSYQVQDKTDKNILISLINEATQEGYDMARACALEIITYNKELEEKERLFKEKQKQLQEEYQNKIKELQYKFENEPLDKLKAIKLERDNGKEDSTGDGVVEQGDGEGSEGD
jgi:hypothetical protein